jgi:hypothetical protein
VNLEQSTRIAVALGREAARSSSLCGVCVEVLVVAGAGITIMGGRQAGPVCVSNTRMAALEDLQFASGVGPCQDAFRFGHPVHTPRFDASAVTRWPTFVDLAHASGVGAVFAYPLTNNGAKVGVLTLYQDHEGDLSSSQNDDSVALVEVLTETVLSLQDAAPVGTLAGELENSVTYRAQIYQASGMVAVQLHISVADALVRIRAHAFGDARTVSAVAADIVARRLRLTNDAPTLGNEV